MTFEIAVDEDEVEEQINRAWESISEGTTRYRSMTFEQGVQAALSWVKGDSEDPPIEDE